MKIALALPPKPKFAQDQYHSIPQKGLGYLAAGLRSNKIDFDIINSKFNNLSEEDLYKILLNGKYDIIGFSAMTLEINSVSRISKRLKEYQKELLTVIGGCHLNSIPKETMEEFETFDLGCLGEHEDQLHSILEFLHARDFNNLSKIDNIIFRKGKKIFYNNLERRFIKDINTLPWPAYELFGSKNLTPTYLTARGCPFSCSFCQRNSGRIMRRRNIGDICDEIEYFTDYFKQKTFSFGDETFTVDKKFSMEICKEMIKRKMMNKLSWTCEAHINTADPELFNIMKEAGCNHITFGVESGSDKILKLTQKKSYKEKILYAFSIAKKAKLTTGALFILGHPGETKSTMLETISLGVRLNPDFITFSIMTPYPGTKVYEYASNNQFSLKLLTKDWEVYDNATSTAMAWDNFSLTTIKIFQAAGLILYHLVNFRFKDLFKYFVRHKKGIIAFLKSILNSK